MSKNSLPHMFIYTREYMSQREHIFHTTIKQIRKNRNISKELYVLGAVYLYIVYANNTIFWLIFRSFFVLWAYTRKCVMHHQYKYIMFMCTIHMIIVYQICISDVRHECAFTLGEELSLFIFFI